MDQIGVSEAGGSLTGRRGLHGPDEAVSLDNLFSLERLPMDFGWFCNLYFYPYISIYGASASLVFVVDLCILPRAPVPPHSISSLRQPYRTASVNSQCGWINAQGNRSEISQMSPGGRSPMVTAHERPSL